MERMLMEYLVNSLWQAPVLAAGAWLVLRAGRPGPRVQHGVWLAALGLMVAMPLLSLRGMGTERVVVPVAEPAAAVVESMAVQDALPAVATASDSPKAAEVSAPWLRMREVRLSAGATHRVVELYLAVILFAMVRLLWGWMVARRMVGDAVAAELSDAELALLGACCERLGVRRPEVLVSGRTSSPLVVGVLRPVLLLPERFAEDVERDGRELEAVWWHELAHVRRRDYLANLLCRVWALPVAYHLATYAVERRVRQTREMVCDRMAAAEMESAVGYARCLVGLAQRMQAGTLQGTAMFGGGVLEERVTELIGTKLVESVRVRAVRSASAVAMLAAVMGVAAMFHVTPTMAQAAEASAADSVALPVATVPISTSDAVVAGPSQALQPERVVDAEADRRDARAVRAAIEGVRRDTAAAQVDGQSRVGDGDAGVRRDRTSYKTWLDQDVVWIIRPEEREAFLRLSNDEERDQFIENFWLRRNPTPGASENSYKEEHYRRIAYANAHFAAGAPGWTTDRGRAYIVNGAPDSVESFPSGAKGEAAHPTEIWHYRSIQGSGREATMKFVDGCNCGDYRLQASEDLPRDVPAKKVMVRFGNPSAPFNGPMLVAGSAKTEQLLVIADGDRLRLLAPESMEGARQRILLAAVQPPAPMQDASPATPVAPVQPDAPLSPKSRLKPLAPVPRVVPSGKGAHVDGFDRDLSPDMQLKLDKEMDATRQQLAEVRKQMKEAMEKMNVPEFRQQFVDAQRAAAKMNTPEFRKQMEEAQRQAKETIERMNSPEFKQQFADAQRAAAKMNTPEFKRQLDEASRQAKEAMEKMNSPEFKKKMEDAQRQAKDAMEKMNSPEFRKQMQEMWAEPKHPDSTESH